MINDKINISNLIVLSLIFFNLFFGNAFHNFGISGIPINEIFLILFLLLIKLKEIIYELINKINFKNSFFLILIGLFYIFFSFVEKGVWAIRDGLFIIDILFIFVGYHFLKKIDDFLRLKKFFILIAKLSFLYIFFYIFSDQLQFLSPKIVTYSGNVYSLFFNFFTLKYMMLWSALILYLFKDEKKFLYLIVSFLLLSSSVILFQSRAVYISIFFCFVLLLFLKKMKMVNLLFFLSLFIFFTFLINFFGINLNERLYNFNIKFLYQHFISLLVPFTDLMIDSDFQAQVSTAEVRLNWWKSILENSTSGIKIFLFGEGFGDPLINFYATADHIPVREPHNSYITFIGRIGYLGTLAWFLFHIKIYKIIKNTYSNHSLKDNEKNIFIIILIYLLIIIVSSFGDSMLQYPCYSIPFYFFIGICLKINVLTNSKKII